MPHTHRKLGALFRPPPQGVHRMRAALAQTLILPVPPACDWRPRLDLSGDDGQPDALGNTIKPNCVECAALRLMQLWRRDGRRPTEAQADELFQTWKGTDQGTYTDTAFSLFSTLGFQWEPQTKIVPRWVVIENDGEAPSLSNVRAGIYFLGGVLAAFRLPRLALETLEWTEPAAGSPGAEEAGYHCVLLPSYNETEFHAVSWGQNVRIDPEFMRRRLVHASAFSAFAWMQATGQGGSQTPSGLSFEELTAIGSRIVGV